MLKHKSSRKQKHHFSQKKYFLPMKDVFYGKLLIFPFIMKKLKVAGKNIYSEEELRQLRKSCDYF